MTNFIASHAGVIEDQNFSTDIRGRRIITSIGEQTKTLPAFWFLANIILLILAASLLIWYVWQVNYLSVSVFQEEKLRSQHVSLMDKNSQLLSQKEQSANLNQLADFSRRQGLVKTVPIVYLTEKNNLAQAERPVNP